ncbi:urease accessory protein UreF [Dongia rigui]|uniref:Urease accessory protein UreF n=1 Tax=Dongia rigui TaxID=940149 RepID=A0ABU5DZ50_9PROT|nr:urease accessory protein UreF [Dongia rigui]MDY0872607.1 urease accessory protein UreF [Dongia rigui]
MDQIPTPIDHGTHSATRLLTWLSPSFPVGGFSYSHGIEYAIEAGLVRDQPSLASWIDGILRFGAGRNDGLLLLAAYRATRAYDVPGLVLAAGQAAALRGTMELAQEASAQGAAFLKAIAGGWPHYADAPAVKALATADCAITYPIIVGTLCAIAGIEEPVAVEAYLTAFANNLISAGIRLVPLGQSDGLRTVAMLEPRITGYVATLAALSLDDLGGAALAVDWSSMKHETQYTRLFRS